MSTASVCASHLFPHTREQQCNIHVEEKKDTNQQETGMLHGKKTWSFSFFGHWSNNGATKLQIFGHIISIVVINV
jgi:hypothetical protein